MRQNSTGLASILLVVGLLSFGLFSSCSNSTTPVEPTPPEPTSLRGVIGPAGGTLTSSDGMLSIMVPQGALTADTELSMTETSTLDPQFGPDAVGVGFAVEPQGLVFLQPVEITYQLAASSVSREGGLTAKIEADLSAAWLMGDEKAFFPEQSIEYTRKSKYGSVTLKTPNMKDMAIVRMWKRNAPPELGHFLAQFDYPAHIYAGQRFRATLEYQLSKSTPASGFLFMQQLGDLWSSNLSEEEDAGDLEAMPVTENTDSYIYPFFLDPLVQGILDYQAIMAFFITLDPLAGLYFPPGWSGPAPRLAFKVGFNDLQLVSEECKLPDCDPGAGGQDVIVINSDLTGLQNIRVAYTETSDPTPFPLTGQLTDPWLYLSGNEGVSYYRINREDTGRVVEGNIIATIAGVGGMGAVPLATGEGSQRAYGLMMYGAAGAWRTNWNADTLEYGAIVLAVSGAVTDVSRYGSVSAATGAAIAVNSSSSVRFLEYDAGTGFYIIDTTRSIFSGVFDQPTGNVVSAYASSANSGVVVAMDGAVGQVWTHDLVTPSDPATLQAMTVSDARQIRGAGDLIAISNYGDDTISLALWDHIASVTPTGRPSVGDGPIGIDVLQRNDGTYVVLSTGSNDGTYTLTEVSAAGTVVSQTTNAVPTECSAPRHAVFVRGPIVYLAFSCFDSGNVVLLETDLQL